MKKIILVLSALVLILQFSYPVIRNVPGSYSTIQAAINASVNSDTILVETGTFMENINFRGKHIVLTSRYYITNDPATIAATIINGSTPVNPDTASCVIISSGEDSTTVLQGFAITGGAGTKWNDEHFAGLYREGGGILIQYSNPIIKDNLIYNNIVLNTAGVSGTGGGGMRIGDGYPRVYNNIVMNNTAKYGAGIVLNYTGGEYKNNIVCSNYGSNTFGSGAGFWLNNTFSRPRILENNTIVNNSAINSYGGVYQNGGTTTFRNNIIWGNTPGAQIAGGTSIITYCDIQGVFPGAGNININPAFSDSSFVLTSGSPCVDKGDSSIIYNDLPDPGNPSLAKYPSRGTLRNDMGAYGGLLSKLLTNSIIGIKTISIEVPSGFALQQNYPNPFNPVTHIKFEIPKNSFVNMVIYDITGNEIATIVNQNLQPGTYDVEFNASDFSSGVYFYKLISGDMQFTRKMILVK